MTTTRLSARLSFGDLASCAHHAHPGAAIVHACKDPCHRHAIGYAARSLPKDHPGYLALERPGHLYLNLIDPPLPHFQLESFNRFLAFVDRLPPDQSIHIHCNQGQSRAPSLALLVMAKRWKLLPAESYVAARSAFPARYTPGAGIAKFLDHNWQAIV